MATKTVTFTPPKNMALAADQLFSTREQRLALQKQCDELQKQETVLREHIINNLPKSEATGITGKLVRATIETKTVYQVDTEHDGWTSLRDYIIKNQKKDPGVWGLMNKALNSATVKEMAEAGKLPPGVKAFDVKVVSLNKVGAK